jgi:hypothetical protein
MEQVFEMKVREKKQKLKDSETDVSVYSWFCIVNKHVPNYSVLLWIIIPPVLGACLNVCA